MASLRDFLTDRLLEALGRPARVARVVRDHPCLPAQLEEPARCIDLRQVAAWHDWPGHSWRKPDEIILEGWQPEPGRFAMFHRRVAALSNFAICETHDDWQCDIQTVEGLSSSKSDLQRYATMDDFVEATCQSLDGGATPGLIEPISEDTLRKRLAHREIRILHHPSTSDHFVRHLWDGRVFLCQSGGSHNLAAARFLAARLGRPLPLRGRLYEHHINPAAVAVLQEDYAMVVLGGGAHDSAFNALHDALGRFGASFLCCGLPRQYGGPHERLRALFFSRFDPRSFAVATLLMQAGAADLGAHLEGLVARQAAMPTAGRFIRGRPDPGRLRLVATNPAASG